jgi:alkylhydroperoxidase/carboxymuconolactone decarboxylase family protein YurZ
VHQTKELLMTNVAKRIDVMKEAAPEAMKALSAFNSAVFQEGALSVLDKQLMAVAAALTTQCVYCIRPASGRWTPGCASPARPQRS